MAKIDVSVVGAQEAIKSLRDLPEKISDSAMGKSITATNKALLRGLRRNAPKRSGIFSASLDTKKKVYQKGNVHVGIIGQRKIRRSKRAEQREIIAGKQLAGKLGSGRGGISGRRDAVPIHLIENDIRAHRIPKEFRKIQVATTRVWRLAQRALGRADKKYAVTRRAAITLRMPSGYVVTLDHVMHPGVQGRQIVAKTLSQMSNEAVSEFERKSKEEIAAIVAKTTAARAETWKRLSGG